MSAMLVLSAIPLSFNVLLVGVKGEMRESRSAQSVLLEENSRKTKNPPLSRRVLCLDGAVLLFGLNRGVLLLLGGGLLCRRLVVVVRNASAVLRIAGVA